MKPVEDHHKLVFENLWKADVSHLGPQIMAIWQRNGGPRASRADERLGQLVYAVRNASGEVVGMSTAFKVYVKQLRNFFFAFRLLLVPEYRIPGLTSRLLVMTRDYLESVHDGGDEAPVGLITIVENRELKEKRNEAVWPASKMVYVGNTGSGHHIRVYYFEGARIKP